MLGLLPPKKNEEASLSVYCFESLFIGLIFVFTVWGALDYGAHNLSIFFTVCCALMLRRIKSYYKSYNTDDAYDKMTFGLVLIIFLQFVSFEPLVSEGIATESILILIILDLLAGFFLFFLIPVLEFAIAYFTEWKYRHFDCLSDKFDRHLF